MITQLVMYSGRFGIKNFFRNNSLPTLKLNEEATRYEFLQFTIKGSGFLWHQIRCIMALLCEIGHGNEKPEVSSSKPIL